MLRSILFLSCLCLLTTCLEAATPAVFPRGHLFFTADFEGPKPLDGWSGSTALDAGEKGGKALVVEAIKQTPPGSKTASISLPVEKMRGYVVQISARIKAEKVSEKPQPWNGVKLMTPIKTPAGMSWPAAETRTGSHDWQRIAFRATVPDDATEMSLVVGLELVSGKAWFDDLRVTAWRPPVSAQTDVVVEPASMPGPAGRLRGAMVSPDIDEASLRVLGQEWKANLIRWQLVRRDAIPDPLDMAAYQRWLDGELKRLDAALPLCKKYGLRVVVDLHSPPGGERLSGGYAGSDRGLFTNAACQRKFVEVWEYMARKYRGEAVIWGFDLANEPVESAGDEGLADWQDLAERTAVAIRRIDPERTLIVEPADWGDPSGLRGLRPLPMANVVYSVHMYLPHALTHQGVHGSAKGHRYPGVIDGRKWDKAALEAALKPVVDFQRRYKTRIYIGEFSIIRWAPESSGYNWLKDVIDIFESHGWDWSYHAFREWDGWSVEHGSDPNDHRRTTEPTDRQRLLREWFSKNSDTSLPETLERSQR